MQPVTWQPNRLYNRCWFFSIAGFCSFVTIEDLTVDRDAACPAAVTKPLETVLAESECVDNGSTSGDCKMLSSAPPHRCGLRPCLPTVCDCRASPCTSCKAPRTFAASGRAEQGPTRHRVPCSGTARPQPRKPGRSRDATRCDAVLPAPCACHQAGCTPDGRRPSVMRRPSGGQGTAWPDSGTLAEGLPPGREGRVPLAPPPPAWGRAPLSRPEPRSGRTARAGRRGSGPPVPPWARGVRARCARRLTAGT